MQSPKITPYLITSLSVLAVIFLVLVYMAFNAARLGGIFASHTLNTNSSATSITGQTIVDDPLITYVPEGNRSAEQKTKVFVSSEDPMLGYDTASVYVVLYGSLLDDTMQNYLVSIKDVQTQQGNDVAIVWKDAVTDELGQQASEVGQCANQQGQFWEYAAAFANAAITDLSSLKALAVAQGSDLSTLEDCLSHAGLSAKVQQSTGLASPLGVTGAHTVFVNDQTFNDAVTIDELNQTIDETLANY